MRKAYFLLFVIGLFTAVCGCGEDIEPEDKYKDVKLEVSVSPLGGQISENTTITAVFSKPVASVTILFNGNPVVPQTANNKTYSFTPNTEGDLTLTIEAEDEYGEVLEGFEPIKFEVEPP